MRSRPRLTPLSLLGLLVLALAAAGCGGGRCDVAAADLGPVERRGFGPGPTRLELHLEVGSVTILGTADPTVSRERRATADARASEEVRGDTLRIEATCPDGLGHRGCRAEYTLRVPAAFAVVAVGDAADLRLRGLTGDLDVRSDAGALDVEDAAGRVKLATDAGRIRATGLRSPLVEASTDAGTVELGFVRAPDLVRARTNAGRVDIALPGGPAAYDVDASAEVGAIDITVPTSSQATRRVEVSTDVGAVRVHA